MYPRCLYRTALFTLGLSFTGLVSAHETSVHSKPAGVVRYVPNQGQWASNVRFKAAFPNSAMFLESDGVTWVRMQDDASDRVHEYIQWSEAEQAAFSLRGHAWKMHFEGADATGSARGEATRGEYHNYFLGADKSRWAANVPVHEGVVYEQLWPGVDLHWYSAEGQVKYDLLLDPGAQVETVGFRYEGLDAVSVDDQGLLHLLTSVGEMVELAPVAWYGDNKEPLACAFELKGMRVGFTFPKGADRGRPIVIDPTLMGATYSGQTGSSNYGHCSTYDAEGNMYGGAQNFGLTFPATLGAFQTSPGGGSGTDIVVNKFSPDATQLLWATYIGGSNDDKPHSMIVNSAGELCILGSSTGAGFPTTSGAFDATHNGASDIVVVHLNNTATALLGSTYLGGAEQDGRQNMTNNYGDTYRGEIMLDAAENIYIASSAQSADFPVTSGAYQASLAGAQDAVIVGLVPDCSSLIMSTFLGGSADDNGLGLRFDATGGLFVCGATSSTTDFPMPAGGWQSTYQGGTRDGYVVHFSADGSMLTAGTFFGTSGLDMAYFIDLDNAGDVYIYGQTTGSVAIEPSGIYGQPGGGIFVASFDPNFTAPIFTTALGADMAPVAFLVDLCDHIYISGYNPSGTWETTDDALYEEAFSQFYLAAYDVDMSGILFGTYYGGSHVDGGTSRFDKRGVIYQGVCSGGQSMPTTSDAYAPTNNVGWDLGVFKIDFEQLLSVGIDAGGVGACVGAPVTLTGTGGATEWTWDLGDGSTATGSTVDHTYDEAGTYTVELVGVASGFCTAADTTVLELVVVEPLVMDADFEVEPIVTCASLSALITNNSSGSTSFHWDLGNGTTSNSAQPSPQYTQPGDYSITLLVIDQYCGDTVSTTNAFVLAAPDTLVDVQSPITLCDGSTAQLQAPSGYDSYLWSTGDPSQNTTVQDTGIYWVDVVLGFCTASDTLLVVPQVHFPPLVDAAICPGTVTDIAPFFQPASILWSTQEATTAITVDEPGEYWFVATDPNDCIVRDTLLISLASVAEGDPFLPNVFTPNGDSKNEVFIMDNVDPGGYSMNIYNRWGMKVFSTVNSRIGWNGKLDNAGETVPDGTYFVIVTYNAYCKSKEPTTLTGHVTLLR